MEIKVELNIPADLEIELSSTFLVEPSRQFGVEHSYTEFLELSNCSPVYHARLWLGVHGSTPKLETETGKSYPTFSFW